MSLWSWITNFFSPKQKLDETHTFEGSPLELVLGTDFSISEWTDRDGNYWASIKILRGNYRGIIFKFNKLKLTDVSEEEGASLSMDYDFIEVPKHLDNRKDLAKSRELNNFIFNIAFTLLSLQLGGSGKPDTQEEDYKNDGDDDTGRDDTGKPDSE